MKRRRRPAGLTDRIERFYGDEGSMLVEASLVLPIFLMLVVLLVCLIKLSAVEMALQSAASQTVRQTATHIRPVYLALQKSEAAGNAEAGSGVAEGTAGGRNEPDRTSARSAMSILDGSGAAAPYYTLPGWTDAAAALAGKLPEPAGTLAQAAVTGDWRPVQDMAAAEIGRTVAEPLLRQLADESVLEKDRIRLRRLSLPDLKTRENPFLVMEVEYAFPIKVPFSNRPIKLRQTVMERVWISDSDPAADSGGGQAGSGTYVQVVSVQPSPVKRGRRTTAVAKTEPGAEVTLEVLYKSGKSVSKTIGKAVAGADGYAQWTWLVSGNTTPGTWEVTVTAMDGTKSSMHFVVSK